MMEKEKEFPKVLYHYTSIDTLEKILSNKTLRLSDLTKSNDSAEIIGLREKVGKKYTIKDLSIDMFLWLGICFSELKDDLHMWSEYGKNGVSIGFSFDGLLQLENELSKKLGIVTYNNKDRNFNKVIYRLYDQSFYTNINFDLFVKSAFVKGEPFACEKEWRLVIPVLKGFIPKGNGLVFSNNRLDISFNTNIIKEIIVSSSCELKEDDIASIIKNNGLNVNEVLISKSQITYRPQHNNN